MNDTVLLATSPNTAENCEKLKETGVIWAKKHTSKFVIALDIPACPSIAKTKLKLTTN